MWRNFKKGHSCHNVFLSFKINFLWFFERGNAFECLTHKVFRLGPEAISFRAIKESNVSEKDYLFINEEE